MGTKKRKMDHIEICLKRDVERGWSGLSDITLVHRALPHLNLEKVGMGTELLGKKLSAPIIVTAMTGGHPLAKKINREMAAVAEELGIGFGLGSQRAMIEDKKLADTYAVRAVAPNALILGNIGIAQVKQYSAKQIGEAVDSIGADALCVHLNPAQEAFQKEGDTDFTGCRDALARLCSGLDVPVVAKEVGNGISSETAAELKSLGISLADVAGTGGTSWIAVEGFRSHSPLAGEFFGWGVPTAVSVLETQSAGLDVIASGGIRTGTDVAKCLALGAKACGFALPVLRAYGNGGRTGVKRYIENVISGLRIAMFLTNSGSVSELGREDIVITGRAAEWIAARGLR